jgi:hypothetical protein
MFITGIAKHAADREVLSLRAMLQDIALIAKIYVVMKGSSAEQSLNSIANIFLQRPGFLEHWHKCPLPFGFPPESMYRPEMATNAGQG